MKCVYTKGSRLSTRGKHNQSISSRAYKYTVQSSGSITLATLYDEQKGKFIAVRPHITTNACFC